MDAVHKWAVLSQVTVQRYAFERAIKALPQIEALALIRATYTEEDGGYATLENAKTILYSIQHANLEHTIESRIQKDVRNEDNPGHPG